MYLFCHKPGRFYSHLRECAANYLRTALRASGGNITKMARTIGVNRQNIHRVMKELNVKPIKPKNKGNAQWQSLRFCLPLVLLLFVSPLFAAGIQYTWTAPTQNTDGSPITETLGYNVQWGTCNTDNTVAMATGSQSAISALTFITPDLAPNTYCGQIQAQDMDGLSAWSNGVKYIIAPPPPPPMSPVMAPQTAYYLIQQPHTPVMIAVGTVPAGTTCDPTTVILVGGTNYFVVPETALVPFGNVKPQLIWAKCA